MGASSGLTYTILEQMVWGSNRVNKVRIACTSYGTDGIPITAALCGLLTLTAAVPYFRGAGAVSNGPVSVWWDEVNSELMLLKATNAGVDAGTNITTAGYVEVLAIGQ